MASTAWHVNLLCSCHARWQQHPCNHNRAALLICVVAGSTVEDGRKVAGSAAPVPGVSTAGITGPTAGPISTAKNTNGAAKQSPKGT